MTAMRLLNNLLAAAALFAALSGCSGAKVATEVTPEATMEWPMGSDGGRIVWVKNIEHFQDLEMRKGIWKRFQELFSGESRRSIVRPYGILHDGAGRIFLADPGGGVVHCVDPERGTYSVIGGEDSPLRTPIGVAEDEKGRIYITDSTEGMVYRYDPEEKTLKPFLAQRLGRPTGIAFNPRNRLLYIADTLESRIVVADQNGVEQKRMGGPGEGVDGFNHPTDLAVDRIGQIYVTDSLNFRITVITPEGQVLRQFGDAGDARGSFSRPKGVAVDSAGRVYVCDALRDAVQVFDADGSPLLVFGKAGTGKGRFWMPSGLYIDNKDYIYVADTYNRRIQIFRFVSGEDAHSGDQSRLGAPVHPSS